MSKYCKFKKILMFLSLISSPLYITSCIDKEIKINEEVKRDLNVYEDLDFNGIKDIEQREFTLDPEIQKYKENQYNVFFDDIKETAIDNSPTFYFNRNAGQVWNTSMQHAISILNYSHKIKNNNTKLIYVGDSDVLKDGNRFNLNYLEEKYGESLIDNKFHLVKDTGKFSYLFNSTEEEYKVIPSKNFLEYIFKPFLIDNPNALFNIVILDISLTGLKADAKEYLFKHTKKLTIISDGNAQLNKFIPEYFEYIKKE
ncbi:hypothetical protein RRG40_04360 [Mycoplasmopsis felis]|uniref:hypothetical protein n=1 Tax=Mycoplasmopsis felis TaxID=33923 RepID=UPI002AFFA231|nr:hypothetical protein [Mycoplasmopsis felis]WQQ05283.1 hypothetical protein RRG59_02915 [Mycoplasmopsis felis]